MYANNERIRTKSFALSTMMLVGTGIAAKLLGAIYRIPLTNILGAEGIGMYQLIFPIYALMLTLSTSGIPTAISRLVSERVAIGDNNGSKGILLTSAIMLTILGGSATVILFIISAPLASLQGNDFLKIGYYAIAPAILIVAGSSFFKGWFQGNLNMMPTAFSQLVEQVVKMGVGLLLAGYLLKYGIVYAVTGAILGLTVSEAVSFIMMFIIYMREGNKFGGDIRVSFRDYGEDILRVSLPITISGLIFPLTQFIDSVLIVNVLRSAGETEQNATALYGILTGPVNSLINMPVIVTLALSIAVVPVVSMNRMKRNADIVKAKCDTAIKLSYLIGVPAFFGIYVMADIIMRALYPSLSSGEISVATTLVRVSSISVVLLAQIQIYTSLLQALDKTHVGIKALSVSAVVKIILNIVLIRYLSIVGGSLATVITYLITVIIDTVYMRRYLGPDRGLFVSIVKIFLAGMIMSFFVILTIAAINNVYISLVAGVGIGVAIYTLSMILLRIINNEELLSLPGGRFLVYIGEKMRFWER